MSTKGWNRTSPTDRLTPKRGSSKRGLHWIGAIIVLVFVGWLAWCLFSSSASDERQTDKKTARRIKEVKPAVARPVAEDVLQKEESEPTNKDPRVVNGIVMYPSWGPVKSAVTGGVYRTYSLAEKCFDQITDLQLATLVTHEPGDYLLISSDEVDFRNFKENFLKSIESPIICGKDDPPEMVALKKAVREARLEIKDRLDAGEDVVKLMIDARKELAELGAYKEELQNEIQKVIAKPETTEEDYDDLIAAANVMLESRGLPKMVMPEMVREHVKYRREYLELMKQNNGGSGSNDAANE